MSLGFLEDNVMFDFDKLFCFQGTHEYLFNSCCERLLYELFPFACVCLNIMLVCVI